LPQHAVIKHWGRSGFSSFGSRIKVRCTLIVKQLRNPQRFIPPNVTCKAGKLTHNQALSVFTTANATQHKPKELDSLPTLLKNN